MKIIAVYNIKGGVGKTATTVNLAYLSALDGARTLIWDLDPQGASTYYFRIKPKIKGGGAKLLTAGRHLDRMIKGTDYQNLDLLPADFSYRNMDIILDDLKQRKKRLKRIVSPLSDYYNTIFIDCAPSMSLVSENIFRVADAIIMPTIPSTLSMRALQQVQAFSQEHDIQKLKLLPFFSMVDRRKKLHQETIDSNKDNKIILKTEIPYASEVERMGSKRKPVVCFAPNSRAAKSYRRLWKEISQVL